MADDEAWERYLPEGLWVDLQTKLPKGLLDHVERVAEICERLAGRHGYDPAKAKATALVHDVARAMSAEELREAARQFGLELGEVEEELPILSHCLVGAEILRRRYGLTDDEMLAAIACHTTGRRNMGTLDKLLFLADKVEPEKLHYRPALAAVRDLAEKDLDRALLKLFDLQLTAFIASGSYIHPEMVEARNEILAKIEERPSP